MHGANPTSRYDIAPGETRTWDGIYSLVTAIHHASEGVEIAARAALEAERAGNESLAGYFRELERDSRRTIERGRNLLEALRARPPTPTRDLVAEQSMESFPASDAPGRY